MEGLEGLLKCFTCNESFNVPSEWDEHKAKVAHTYSGTSTCQDCGKPNCKIEFTGTLEPGKSPPAICKECEAAYIKELKDKGLIK